YSSGETHRQGKISKCGSAELRYLLSEAATSAMFRTKLWNKDKAWAFKIMKKHGIGKARMAYARKMAVKLHSMRIDEKDYENVEITPEEIKSLQKIKEKKKPKKNQIIKEKTEKTIE